MRLSIREIRKSPNREISSLLPYMDGHAYSSLHPLWEAKEALVPYLFFAEESSSKQASEQASKQARAKSRKTLFSLQSGQERERKKEVKGFACCNQAHCEPLRFLRTDLDMRETRGADHHSAINIHPLSSTLAFLLHFPLLHISISGWPEPGGPFVALLFSLPHSVCSTQSEKRPFVGRFPGHDLSD